MNSEIDQIFMNTFILKFIQNICRTHKKIK